MRKKYKKRPISERFWKKVNKDGPIPTHCPELGNCWIWTRFLDPRGYGRFGIDNKRQRSILAHRVSWFLAYGAWPVPNALHKCDNPSCVRPSHLFQGTHADNSQDALRKGRLPNLIQIKDCSEQRFGYLYCAWFVGTTHHAHFLCMCDCGNLKVISGITLRAGKILSCGIKGCPYKKLLRLENRKLKIESSGERNPETEFS